MLHYGQIHSCELNEFTELYTEHAIEFSFVKPFIGYRDGINFGISLFVCPNFGLWLGRVENEMCININADINVGLIVHFKPQNNVLYL